MVYGISTAGIFVFIVFINFPSVICDGSRIVDNFMRLRRQAWEQENCCKVYLIDEFLETFPPIEVRHILKKAENAETLEEYCMEYERHLVKLMDYGKGCCFDHKHHLVKQQVEGIEELYVTTCLNKPTFDQLVQNSKCLTDVLESSTECLAEEANNAIDDPESKEMCPRLRSVIDCFTEQASDDCSLHAASLLNKLFKRVVKATIRVDCGVCFHVRPDGGTSKFTGRARLTATVIVLGMIIFSLLILRCSYSRNTCV